MFFRNLTFFRFPASLAPAIVAAFAAGALEEARAKPVGLLEMQSRGFVSPFGVNETELSHQVGKAVWLTVGGEDRILPASAFNAELSKKIAEFEGREGRKLGGKARKRLKEDLIHEMLPRALVKPSRTDAYIDLGRGFIVVDTPSRKRAEAVVTELRHALGSFAALPLNAELSARSVMTAWIAGEQLPDRLSLGEECVLEDTIDGGATVKCQNQELLSDEIRKHLDAGKQVTRLGLAFDDHASFVFGDDLVLRKLKFLDGAVDKLDDTERDSLRAELDARFALMSGVCGQLFDTLVAAFKISSPEA